MWLRRAAVLPWQVLGALTLLSVSVAVSPFKVLRGVLKPHKPGPSSPPARQVTAMPKEYYDLQEVSAMLRMVRAAMLDTTQQLHAEHTKVAQLSQQVDELQASLENVNHLFIQEQQHRLGLQAELDEAEIAAADLRQMLTVFFGESHHGSPNSSPGTLHNRSLPNDGAWAMASSCQLPSGLPGTLHRGDSRIQCDLASIQNRLKKIAQLRDMPPSSPRSAERISPWLSLSAVGKASPFGELGHMRTLGKLSPVKLSPLKADSSQANRCNTQASTLQQVASSIDSDTEAECEVESLKLNATQGTLSADAMFIGNSDKCLNN